jgi:drug/metabolite transporter (DMT)-like permease
MGSRDDTGVPEPLLPPAVAVIVLGLLASLGWGIADFGGGLTSRRAPVLGVLLGSQIASIAVGLPILAAVSEPAMRPIDLAVSIGGGVLAAAGLSLLYRGLSVGRMGVVAPVAAVITATEPVAYGFATQGVPSALALVGILAAVVSVVLVSRSPDAADGRPSGLWYGVAAGILFGLFTIGAAQLNDDLILSPVVVIRVASVLVITIWILLRRQPWRVPRSLWPALVGVGVMDMSATAAYLAAIAVGPLSIAAILASLYPVVTTILAALFLRERVTPIHAAGILAAGVAVALIAGAPAV